VKCSRLALLVLGAALAACASLPVSDTARDVDPAAGLMPVGPALPPDATDPLALDASLRQFLATLDPEQGPADRLRDLLAALQQQGVIYGDHTRSVAATFAAGQGDCLSLAGLTVALGRALGLKAAFQEVELPPLWTRRSDMVVQSRHVNAVFDLGVAGKPVVDFNREELRPAYPRRLISDQRAFAHYHNNRAAEALLGADLPAARRWLALALQADPGLAAAWVNLGLLYRREGLPALAEASYLRALALAPGDLAAMSNLVVLHRAQGRPDLARWFEQRSAAARLDNPYYRYALAEDAYGRGDYGLAARQLRAAIRRNPAEDSFYALLGLASLRQGRTDEARRCFVRAEQLARDDGVRALYRRKLALLDSPAPG